MRRQPFFPNPSLSARADLKKIPRKFETIAIEMWFFVSFSRYSGQIVVNFLKPIRICAEKQAIFA